MTGPALEVDGIRKRYGRRQAVADMTFGIRAGELFGFVGSNGAGKTTTMRIILGVLTPDEGEVRWRGRPVDFAARRQFGYMPEERGLYPRMKVGEHLRYLGELHGLPSAAARAAADRWIERLELSKYASEEVQNLSLGNQQRVQLAAALVHEPKALVLDEPFSGLDPVAVDVMHDVLVERAADGVPVMFSSHQLSLVERVCDRVGIVGGGRLVACGTVEELSENADRRLMVDAPEAGDNWAAGLPGVAVVSREGTRTWLRLAKGADDQRVLHAALATGPVSAFVSERPPLSDLYRDLVTRTGAPGENAGRTADTDTDTAAGVARTANNTNGDDER
ncbi:ATP-binding cassette domain-containing protein [Streptomyces coeruleorubidus]|uniref:ABC transporter ATP-binding protein n=1 Tax=Streptomyces coeruleorubidus TaxID=116188 RepID=UPI00237F44FF|nr:ATP-binding cassette domain-containing protein [Streptomyces coeruleorubidus]WDV51842.1 ATP-binding cassette domain-containing protein [Streptomyces coeruleorubidus]